MYDIQYKHYLVSMYFKSRVDEIMIEYRDFQLSAFKVYPSVGSFSMDML